MNNSSAAQRNGRSLPDDGVVRTKILLLGLRRSGKTSVREVLFNGLPPKQTFYLETTMRVVKHPFDTVIPLEIWDCPGNITVDTLGAPLSQFSSMIFIIDIRDLYQQPISKLVEFIKAAYHENRNIHVEVFVHKAEKLAEDDKIENFRQIHERLNDRLLDLNPAYEQIPVNFHLTSVYDHSLHEAFSKVLHKLIDCLPHLEDLLNIFCSNSQSPKAFLFDTKSRLYVATDASPVDSATHNLCCDFLQMISSFGSLYKSSIASPPRHRQPVVDAPKPTTAPPPSLSTPSPPASPSQLPSSPMTSSSTMTSEANARNADPGLINVPSSTVTHAPKSKHPKSLFYPSCSTSLQPSTPGTTLTFHLITQNLALVAVMPTGVYEGRRGLVEYNVVWLREGVQEIWDVEREARGAG